MAVDFPDDAPQADAQVGGSSRRSRNRHGCTSGRIIAPVEEVLRRDREGRVQRGRPWVGQTNNGRDAKMPEDTTDGRREIVHDGWPQRSCSAAHSVGANYSSVKASEKQSKRSEPPRCSMSRVNFQEYGRAKLRDAGKKLSVVQKYFMNTSMGYFDVTNQARHQRIFTRKCKGPNRSIRTTISAWKMDIPTSNCKKVPVRYCSVETPELNSQVSNCTFMRKARKFCDE